jgi:arylformamidase
MQSAPVEILFGGKLLEPREVLGSQTREVLDELVEGGIGVAVSMRESVEPLEGHGCAVLEDPLRALDPVGQLTGDQVADHVFRPPSVIGDVGRVGPGLGNALQEDAKQVRRPPQEIGRLTDEVAHSSDRTPALPRSVSPARVRRYAAPVAAVIDISVPIRPGMPVWAGDPPVVIERVQSIADGAHDNVSRIDFGVHTGTHVDAPLHFIDDSAGVDRLPLDALIGPAFVVDATNIDRHLDVDVLAKLAIPQGADRVLFKTRNSELWERDRFETDFLGVTADGARWLVDLGVRLVGIDYLSIAPYGQSVPTHWVLLDAGIVILEGTDLRGVEPGDYELICAPLRIVDSDGAPARALLVRR